MLLLTILCCVVLVIEGHQVTLDGVGALAGKEHVARAQRVNVISDGLIFIYHLSIETPNFVFLLDRLVMHSIWILDP